MVLIGLPKNFSSSPRTLGMRVEPPTSTISSTSLFSRPASESTWVVAARDRVREHLGSGG